MRLVSRLVLLGIAAGSVTVSPLHSECPLELRSYEDADRNGFVLELDPSLEEISESEVATARLLHRDRGEVARFRVLRTSRDRLVFLIGDRRFRAYFFTRDLRSTDADRQAHYLFLPDLDSLDEQSGTPVGDVLWELSGCKE